jgi:hypothetical protein
MDIQKFLSNKYVVKSVKVKNIDSLLIFFEKTDLVLNISGMNECCDTNEFKFISPLEDLIGSTILSITENEVEVEVEDNSCSECLRKNEIKIEYNSNTILKELKNKNLLWNKLPKDILETIGKELISNYIFYRMNYSNGYYVGYLEITIRENF